MITKLILLSLTAYRRTADALIPFLPLRLSCPYEPSCSHYMESAVREAGVWRGVPAGLRRLARCHPFARGGYDPFRLTEVKRNSHG